MTGRPRLPLLALLVLALAIPTLPLTGASGADRPDPGTLARHHLRADAGGAVRITAGRSGRVGFVGTTATTEIDNPDVPRGASVAQAARAHLDRYGAALGATGDSTFVRRSVSRAVSGADVVTYGQEVDGVPVLGGDVVVSMASDGGLRSIASTASGVGSVSPATLSEADAGAIARGVVARSSGATGLRVTAAGRWLLDPEVVEVDLPSGPRTVWRFEVGDGVGVRQLVLVDDHTGGVLLRADLIEHADPDRVVCDRQDQRGAETACTTGFARTEGDAPSIVTDVNDAFDLSGVVSTFYQQVAGVSLTQLLGVDVGGVRKLASTVRFCTAYTADPCPYDNAFWNGQQMFYGHGWASADDVVGHEMTHGFIDQYSRLFYWGQSGAINESMADVIGEIVDHRHASPSDTAGDWHLGEDSPVGAIRSLADPTAYGQPDRMTSADYTADPSYGDAGGVHTNSGVGNKTAYLISQGGSFNGQTITGIDGADTGLTKTASLYVDVIERLSSGSDYAALAQQLDQSCQDLRALGTAGFTVADCVAVHQAGTATELTSPPANVPTTTPADTSCPAGTTKHVLFDSEAGTPSSAFTPTTGAPTGWRRGSGSFANDAWFADDPAQRSANSLTLNGAIALPAGQQSYLSFRGWWVLDFVSSGPDAGFYDGGTVELGVDGAAPSPLTTGWTNGPEKVLTTQYSNPWGGRAAFAGDSRGWVQSRVDLSGYGGKAVRPSFTLRSDDSFGLVGWALDDITVYTCDPLPPSAVQGLAAAGSLRGMTLRWSPPATGAQQVAGYQVSLSPCVIAQALLPATSTSLTLSTAGKGCGGTIVVRVGTRGLLPLQEQPAASITVQVGIPWMSVKRTGARLTFKGGVFSVDRHRVAGGLVAVQRKSSSGWVTVRTVRTGSTGSFSATYRHRTKAYYRAAYLGGPGLIGSTTGKRRW